MIEMFKNIYQYRELLKTNIKKEIRGKYKHSFLGVLWSFLYPLLQLAVYAIIFPLILRNTQDHYVIFLCVALIPWNYFTTIVTQSTGTIIANGDIVKKVYFPREILPISVVTSQLVNFLISTIIILAFVLFSGMGISKYILFYPVILLIQYIFSIGVAFIVSSAMLVMNLLNMPRAMWIGIACMSVCLPFSKDIEGRAGKRGAFNVIGCLIFSIMYIVLPKSMYPYIGMIGGIGVGYSAGYSWQTVFNTFGALSIAAELFGLKYAVLLRIGVNVVGAAYTLLCDRLIDKIYAACTGRKVETA